jgi:hypothetical protein
MLQKARTLAPFFKRYVKPKYITAQIGRWEGQGVSSFTDEGWTPLNPTYDQRKRVRFKNYPGSGTKMGIATNRLVDSILARSGEYKELTGDRTLLVSTTVGYATHFNEKRSIKKFTRQFYEEIKVALMEYVKK